MTHPVIASWHDVVARRDDAGLASLIADEAVFHSPVVHTPQRGKASTVLYLTAAFKVLANDSFRYVREVVNGRNAMLEFEVRIEGIDVNGVDMIAWNDEGRIVDFKVMLRPLQAINLIHRKMGELLARQSLKDRAVAFLEMVAAGQVQQAYDEHVGTGFRHHNPYFRSDATSLRAAMSENHSQFPEKRLDVQRALQDGSLVAVHSRVQQTRDGRPNAIVHIFRFADGRIAELWDIGQPAPEDSPNELGMF